MNIRRVSRDKEIYKNLKESLGIDISDIEKYFISRMTKYEVLDTIFDNRFNKEDKLVTIFLDIDTIYSSIFNPKYIEGIKSLFNDNYNRVILTSYIVNLTGHLRRYFVTRHNMLTNFVIYYSYDECKMLKKIHPDFKSDYYNKRNIVSNTDLAIANKFIRSSLNLIKILYPSLPNIFLINSAHIEPSIIPSMFSDTDEKKIIMTSNKLMSNYIDDNTFILTPKSDNSKLYDKFNIYDFILDKESIEPTISNDFIKYLFSVSGYSKYSVDGIPKMGLSSTYKLFTNLVKTGDLNSLYNDKQDIFNLVCKKKKNASMDILERNYTVITDKAKLLFNDMDKTFINNQLINAISKDNLIKINNDYFKRYPINIDNIFMSEE